MNQIHSISPLTKTTCKRIIGALQDLDIEQYELVIQGNALRVIVGREINDSSDISSLIEGVV